MRVFTNLAVSVDGKIADFRNPKKPLGTPLDRRIMRKLRDRADVIIVGAETLRVHPFCYKGLVKPKRNQTSPVNAVITASGDLPDSSKFWDDPDVIRFIFTTSKGFARARLSARERAFIEVCGEDAVDPHQVIDRLKKSGLRNILIEGGGGVMALFLEAELVDEINVTLTPWLLGGKNNPSLVGGLGLPTWSKLKLKKIKRVGSEVYLTYLVK